MSLYIPADQIALHLNQVFICAVTHISVSIEFTHSSKLYNSAEKDIKGQNSIQIQEYFGVMKNYEKQPFDLES